MSHMYPNPPLIGRDVQCPSIETVDYINNNPGAIGRYLQIIHIMYKHHIWDRTTH